LYLVFYSLKNALIVLISQCENGSITQLRN
jgi:hypothetical protein